MTHPSDDELRRHLDRRAGAWPLEGDSRHELLAAIAQGARTAPRQRWTFGWSAVRWASAAAVALVFVVVVAPLVPPASQPPGASPATSTPVILPSPITTSWAVRNFKALAAAANDPASYGTVVVADVEFGVRQPEGYVFVQDTNPDVVVTHLDPVQAVAGVYAFRVWSGEVETLGRVALHDRGRAWTVNEIRALPDLSGEEPVDLYPVRAWLVGGASTDEQAWLTTDRFEPVGANAPADAITLQEGAYFDLASNPRTNDRGTTEPRLGVYLIRPGDCTGGGTCPAQLVGVLDPPTPRHPTGLTLAGDVPIRLIEAPDSWYGFRVRMCNETSDVALTYVAYDARLLLSDGTIVRAANRLPDLLQGQLQPELDKATLAAGACAEGWLVFGTSSDATPVRIQWHGRILDVAGSADETTQSAVLVVVVGWLTGAEGGLPSGPLYVDESVVQELRWFEPERHPALASAGEPLFGDTLTDSSKAAIQAILAARGDVQFVPDPTDVVDPEGIEHFGCRPYLNRRPMLHFGAPRQVDAGVYLIEVNVDRGCQGELYLLEVSLVDGVYAVTVVAQGNWIV